jgi:hypothetical protein
MKNKITFIKLITLAALAPLLIQSSHAPVACIESPCLDRQPVVYLDGKQFDVAKDSLAINIYGKLTLAVKNPDPTKSDKLVKFTVVIRHLSTAGPFVITYIDEPGLDGQKVESAEVHHILSTTKFNLRDKLMLIPERNDSEYINAPIAINLVARGGC